MTVPWRDNHYIVTGYDVEKQQGDREKIFVSITPFLIFVWLTKEIIIEQKKIYDCLKCI